MSEENTEILEDATEEEAEDLQEFKSDDRLSEIPEPTKVAGQTRKEGKKKSTKVGMLNDMMTKLHGMNKETLKGLHSKMMEETEEEELGSSHLLSPVPRLLSLLLHTLSFLSNFS